MLSRSSEYAIRALTYLAQRPQVQLHLAREMAEQLHLPAPFLGKVLQPLVTKGLIRSQRGRSGGFSLAKPPAQIRLLDIVEAEEGLASENKCLLGQLDCSDANACPMHEYWQRAANEFRDRLTRTTLADLLHFAATHPNCAYPLQNPGSSLSAHISDTRSAM
ncbi:MAG: Rrf2 family transcriptional regulator [Planctomycetes bacterium]|nr:Rrf2 family transcriptional regulator [Planctomycetota bacterium]